MGEAAPCLMRSVSQPLFVSCEFKEGDPLRALTTSISFGRFMTEPLDWEKWSSFSHNRTLEDVQKYSRPGAVAEKKAFFEAYYKKFASKKSAKSPKKENKPPSYSPQTNVSPVTVSNTRENESPTLATDENMSNRGAESEISSTLEDVCLPSTNLVFSETGNADDIISSTCQLEQEKTSTQDVPLPSTKLVSRNRGVESEIASNDDVSLPSTNLVFSENGNVEDIISSSVQMAQEKTPTENIHPSPVEMSNHVDKNKKRPIKDKISNPTKPEISLVKYSSRKTSVSEIQPKKVARNVMDKKISALQSLNVSMKFPSFRKNNETSKALSKTRMSSVNGEKRNSHVHPRPENKRSKPLLDRSVIGSKTAVLKPISTNHSEITACTEKPRSTTVFSSFSFKSDERAAKRKEFFQKLEEKGNANKTEKIQLQSKLKGKARSDNKKLRWSTALEAKPSTNETKRPINIIQMIMQVPPTQPRSPKLGKKSTCYQSPLISSSKPKNFIEINKKKISSSLASLPTKKK